MSKSERIELRLESDLLEEIDAARSTNNGQIPRSEWIRQALKYVLRLEHYQKEVSKLRDKVSPEIMEQN
jgi:metal-responsive CopG/Arc/MetJ family transcriptional regulator